MVFRRREVGYEDEKIEYDVPAPDLFYLLRTDLRTAHADGPGCRSCITQGVDGATGCEDTVSSA